MFSDSGSFMSVCTDPKTEGDFPLISLRFSAESQSQYLMNTQRWEFIKENKKVRKQELDQESDQEKK